MIEKTIIQNIPASEYKISTINLDEIKIVEMYQYGCDYYDFVLVYYNAVEETLTTLNQFHEKYKVQKKTICFIGCICDESFELEKDYSEYFSYFDLNSECMMEDEFDNLVLSCYACRGGVTYEKPENWLNLKKDDIDSLCCIYKTGKTVNEAFEKMYKDFLYVYLKYPDCRKIKKAIITVLANEVEIPEIERESVYKLIYFFDKEYSLMINANINCSEIKKGTVMVTLI